MTILEELNDRVLFLDGAMGTLLQEAGLKPGEEPERWNLSHPDKIVQIHETYFRSGSDVVLTNTFGANRLKFGEAELREIVRAAVSCAKTAAENVSREDGRPRFAALDIGPSGRLLKPYGDLDFEDAVALFSETVKIGAECGADFVFIETMNDLYETKAALLAAKESASLPVFVSNAYGADGKLMTGASPEAVVAVLEGMGADAVGVNCSLGPNALKPVILEYLRCASVPVFFKPNAGLPSVDACGHTHYDVGPDDFTSEVSALVKAGVRMVGGCCGSTPDYIRALRSALGDAAIVPVTPKDRTVVASYTHAVVFGERPVLIGERINPTGKKKLKQALLDHDLDYLLGEGISQQEAGADILDVNVGLPGIDEPAMLTEAVCELQAVVDLPLQIDTSDARAMENALRRYNGKAMVNSVNGKRESMEAVFPLVKKYGGLAVCLTLDEDGIPDTVEGRFAIAKKILKTAESYGIDKKDLIFDTLAMTVSASSDAARVTLGALKKIREELGCHTSLGVSNISFGLPARETVNSTFFALALENGLSAAIMNPHSAGMMQTYHAFRALRGMDESCLDYIAYMAAHPVAVPVSGTSAAAPDPALPAEDGKSALQRAIAKGLKNEAGTLASALCRTAEPLSVIQNEVIPALNDVGVAFEKKTLFLPQLLMSAEAASAAVDEVKAALTSSASRSGARCRFVIATVQGDIHDIGKNIVKLLLESYGFLVEDLGRDVPPQTVLDAVIRLHAPLCGLSALMTTTVPAMEETIRLIHENAPWCKVVVGGAVLTKEYAERIGADRYGRDAMETVRFAEEVERELMTEK